jgi:hypothetical protein
MSIPSFERAYKEGKSGSQLAISKNRERFFHIGPPKRRQMSQTVDFRLLELTPTAVFMRLTGVP